MPCQTFWWNIDLIAKALYIFTEHPETADPAAMVAVAFIGTLATPKIT
jgi:hypothetical protein